MGDKTIVIVAGGTGGHLYPGIATAHALLAQGQEWEPIFIVRKGDLGKGLLQREKFRVFEIAGQGWPRKPSKKMLAFPLSVVTGFYQAWKLLRLLEPKVVMGMGGYLSFPVLLAAKLQRVPTLIHEQNVFPGLSNRVTGCWVSSIAVSFPESKKAFPQERVWVSGLPVRAEIGSSTPETGRARLGLSAQGMTFLVFGGSQGAHRLNEAVAGACRLLALTEKNFQILHVTGERDFPTMQTIYKTIRVPSIVMPYCHDMAAALAAADFVICRAGASTVVELVVAHKPALLVPFPFASENHQFYNAQMLVDRRAAELMTDAELSPERIADVFRRCIQQPESLVAQRKQLEILSQQAPHAEAAKRLAEFISTLS